MPFNELHQHLEDPRDFLDQYFPSARQAMSRKQAGQVGETWETRRWL